MHHDEHGRIQHAQSKVAKAMRGKMHKVMHEFKHHELHSGSKHGPEVKSRKQAIAIGMSEARRRGHK
jgi:Family of unknown function (DUF6496)